MLSPNAAERLMNRWRERQAARDHCRDAGSATDIGTCIEELKAAMLEAAHPPENGLTVPMRLHHLSRGQILASHHEDGSCLWWRLGIECVQVHDGGQAHWSRACSMETLTNPDAYVTLHGCEL